jgi:hypothetical protein
MVSRGPIRPSAVSALLHPSDRHVSARQRRQPRIGGEYATSNVTMVYRSGNRVRGGWRTDTDVVNAAAEQYTAAGEHEPAGTAAHEGRPG